PSSLPSPLETSPLAFPVPSFSPFPVPLSSLPFPCCHLLPPCISVPIIHSHLVCCTSPLPMLPPSLPSPVAISSHHASLCQSFILTLSVAPPLSRCFPLLSLPRPSLLSSLPLLPSPPTMHLCANHSFSPCLLHLPSPDASPFSPFPVPLSSLPFPCCHLLPPCISVPIIHSHLVCCTSPLPMLPPSLPSPVAISSHHASLCQSFILTLSVAPPLSRCFPLLSLPLLPSPPTMHLCANHSFSPCLLHLPSPDASPFSPFPVPLSSLPFPCCHLLPPCISVPIIHSHLVCCTSPLPMLPPSLPSPVAISSHHASLCQSFILTLSVAPPLSRCFPLLSLPLLPSPPTMHLCANHSFSPCLLHLPSPDASPFSPFPVPLSSLPFPCCHLLPPCISVPIIHSHLVCCTSPLPMLPPSLPSPVHLSSLPFPSCHLLPPSAMLERPCLQPPSLSSPLLFPLIYLLLVCSMQQSPPAPRLC
ncbi:unnamed protein product, partial [Closterium sp. Naga37s-1]